MTEYEKDWLFMGLVGCALAICFGVGFYGCSYVPTCADCVKRCQPIDVKSCNIDRSGGEWKLTCECQGDLKASIGAKP